jgi:hypothetical protein
MLLVSKRSRLRGDSSRDAPYGLVRRLIAACQLIDLRGHQHRVLADQPYAADISPWNLRQDLSSQARA